MFRYSVQYDLSLLHRPSLGSVAFGTPESSAYLDGINKTRAAQRPLFIDVQGCNFQAEMKAGSQ